MAEKEKLFFLQMYAFLVLDSSPLIAPHPTLDLKTLALQIITTPETMQEIRDKRSKALLPNELLKKTPGEKYMRFVINFSKLTGDYHVLSIADLKILALTVQLVVEHGGWSLVREKPTGNKVSFGKSTDSKLRVELENACKNVTLLAIDSPACVTLSRISAVPMDILPTITEEEEIDDEDYLASDYQNDPEDRDHNSDLDETQYKSNQLFLEKVECISDLTDETNQLDALSSISNLDANGNIMDDDSDEEGWITPTSLKMKVQVVEKKQNLFSPQSSHAACMTSDYAMQNMCVQMNIPLVSPHGQRITKLKSWVMRCHGCYFLTREMGRQFCERCGGNSLLRTSVGVDANGNLSLTFTGKTTIFLKKNFQYNNRGTQYNIPAQKGGRSGTDLILCQDQREHTQVLKTRERMERKALSMDLSELGSMFGDERKLSRTGKVVIGYGRANPNQARRRK